MPFRFNDHSPIYQQLCEHFENLLLSGSLKTGEKLPSVRDLAMEYGVNPNTMQKALSILEERGLMFSERTSGRFITHDEQTIDNLKTSAMQKIIQRYFYDMEKIGYDKIRAIELLQISQ